MLQKGTTEGNFGRAVPYSEWLGKLKQLWLRSVQKLEKGANLVFLKWGLLLFIVGVMLGRAAILSDLYPFALPFFAAVFVLRKNKALLAATAVLIGTIWGLTFNVPYVLAGLFLFLVFYQLVSKYKSNTRWALPATVFAASFISRLAITYFTMGTVSQYHLFMGAIEAGLALMLTMIFLQSLPLLSPRRKQRALKNEEIVCFVILIASVMTGAIGWVIYGLGAEHVLARYLVLLFALAGGAAIGSTVGVVTGLILSLATVVNLYQMSLLAFAGLLGGLLKDGNKLGVSFGLFVGTALIALYGQGLGSAGITVMESVAAIALFLLTPKSAIQYLAKYVPGTVEHSHEQQRYMRKIRDVTAARVERFSDLFSTLSSSFTNDRESSHLQDKNVDGDRFLADITSSTCQKCFRKETCWVERFDTTYDLMGQVMTDIEEDERVSTRSYEKLKRHCIYPDRIAKTMKEQWGPHELRKVYARQLEESRRLVADQLQGVSQVMGDFAKEIQKEKEAHEQQEEQIHTALHDAGIDIGQVEVYNLTPRDVRIEIELGEHLGIEEAEKLIAPMLSGILSDHIIVDEEERERGVDAFSKVSFVSAKTYTIDRGSATVAQGGAWLSGDNHAAMQLGYGKFAVAISDGMGNGKKAYEESKATLNLLENLLQSGIDEKVAIQSMNSVLSLRADEEMFSTLDLTMIDLQTADTSFIKIGSMPSFIKRAGHVFSVESANLPMGIISEANFDVVTETLQDEDLLIMMSDGMFDGPKFIENKERWMKRIIAEMETDDPQELSDLLLEEVIRVSEGTIGDDMTVVVTKIKRNTPRWATIPMNKWKPPVYKQAQ
ncbi:stage II sporulation protein E [Geomicrobium sp. JCM 19039]|uniref:stage II sporulation protein E n=1 Tax=Geomicrobium sp. JCM 19039 TaxID=1460636 RepID=UPI00045F1732|nr:stage II sporulation protein E [Geomicrobium sp. JCM 19039]GAK13909.1 stage II sporulation serine phosphatase for sigma-F activation [Geomicrobium sp. JCM 19039]